MSTLPPTVGSVFEVRKTLMVPNRSGNKAVVRVPKCKIDPISKIWASSVKSTADRFYRILVERVEMHQGQSLLVIAHQELPTGRLNIKGLPIISTDVICLLTDPTSGVTTTVILPVKYFGGMTSYLAKVV